MRTILLLMLSVWSAFAACTPPPNNWDWEAARWRSQILTNSGTISGGSYLNGTLFMQQSKWWGIRPQLGRVGLYLGNQTNAILVPIIRDWWSTTDAIDDLIAFVAADYTEATGMTGNTTTKFLRVNQAFSLNLSSFTTVDSIHEAVYIRTNTQVAGYCMGGTSGTATCGMPISFSGNSYIEFHTGNDPVADASGVGFYLGTRVSSSSRTLYKNAGTVMVTSSTCAGALGAGGPIVHGFRSAGTDTAFTSSTLSYYAFGKGIVADKVPAYNTLVQGVQRRASRKVN